MVRESKTQYALLGLLSWGPQSGYDMRKTLDDSLGNFWSESYGQIYPTLQQLEGRAFIRRLEAASPGPQQKNVFAITQTGVEALKDWLRRPAAPLSYRIEALVKVFFAPLVGAEECKRHIERFRDEHQALLTRYEGYEKSLCARFAKRPELPFWLLTVDCGIRISRAYIEWCDHAVRILDTLPATNRARTGLNPLADVTAAKPGSRKRAHT